jgi:hypothetical protein
MAELKIYPVTLAVSRRRLEQIVDEERCHAFRSALNTIIAQVHF